ncbi:hypothetical protein EIP91_002187 [Steccherinum ochraceum]|uniref:Uncharacterized protein n=1 Tax=Steccherinum ochraceum TaxID=92696 RepID=A0A4R0RTC3_9APHY|nr:hypothetical protein EIP91_002187 [Steccherinum ochraceum]
MNQSADLSSRAKLLIPQASPDEDLAILKTYTPIISPDLLCSIHALGAAFPTLELSSGLDKLSESGQSGICPELDFSTGRTPSLSGSMGLCNPKCDAAVAGFSHAMEKEDAKHEHNWSYPSDDDKLDYDIDDESGFSDDEAAVQVSDFASDEGIAAVFTRVTLQASSSL